MKTAITRAAEAVEAAEKVFADEMGATLDLSPAAKAALIAMVSVAIQAAVAEERECPGALSADYADEFAAFLASPSPFRQG